MVAVHSHPRFGTVWADAGRIPGCFDQSSALGGGELVIVDEYDGPVNDRGSAARAVEAMGTADMALLANHGVFVTAGQHPGRPPTGRGARVPEPAGLAGRGPGGGRELPDPARSFFRASDGEGFIGFFEAMARQELRQRPTLPHPTT